MTAAVLLLHGVGTPSHSGSLLLSFSLPFLCLPLSVSLLISPVFGFYCFGSFSLNTVGFSLSRFPSPFSALFSFLLASLSLGFPPRFLPFSLFFWPPSFPLLRVTIYRGRGSGVDPAPSHRCPCMGRTSPALLRCRPWWPMEASLAGHGCSDISS